MSMVYVLFFFFYVMCFFFFFQAEDGIRGVAVTGVQTCALPILVADGLKDLPIRIQSLPVTKSVDDAPAS